MINIEINNWDGDEKYLDAEGPLNSRLSRENGAACVLAKRWNTLWVFSQDDLAGESVMINGVEIEGTLVLDNRSKWRGHGKHNLKLSDSEETRIERLGYAGPAVKEIIKRVNQLERNEEISSSQERVLSSTTPTSSVTTAAGATTVDDGGWIHKFIKKLPWKMDLKQPILAGWNIQFQMYAFHILLVLNMDQVNGYWHIKPKCRQIHHKSIDM